MKIFPVHWSGKQELGAPIGFHPISRLRVDMSLSSNFIAWCFCGSQGSFPCQMVVIPLETIAMPQRKRALQTVPWDAEQKTRMRKQLPAASPEVVVGDSERAMQPQWCVPGAHRGACGFLVQQCCVFPSRHQSCAPNIMQDWSELSLSLGSHREARPWSPEMSVRPLSHFPLPFGLKSLQVLVITLAFHFPQFSPKAGAWLLCFGTLSSPPMA